MEQDTRSNGTASGDSILKLRTYKALRSDEVNEIISHRHNFIERWALLIFLFVVLALFAATWFVRYKDIIQSTGSLTAANAPKEIVARHEGKLIRLFVGNDKAVAEGEVIGWIESTASHREVNTLDSLLNTASLLLEKNEMEKVSVLFKSPMEHLGDIQSYYQQFIASWQVFNDFFVNGYCYQKKRQLSQDRAYLQQLHRSLEEQKLLFNQDLQLTKEGLDANNSLFRDSVISRQEMRDQTSKMVSKQMTLPQVQISLLNNDMQELSKQKEIAELDHNISLQKDIFQQALHTLKSVVEGWVSAYIIKSAVPGRVVFIAPLQENQFLMAGKVLGYVNPPEARYNIQANLQQANLGKLELGQKVQIRFDAYPYQEFGFVNGVLDYISKIPSDSGFLARIKMPDGLETYTGKTIQYRSGLRCQVIIITKETRLMKQFFYGITKELNR